MKYFIRDFFAKAYMCFCALKPLDNKCIVFKSDRGLQCTDSPYALFQEVRENYLDFKCIWVLKDLTKVPEGAVAVKEGSLQEIKALAISKYWIDNKRKGCWTRKRKGQVYIQTWHGPIAIKKIERDIEDRLPEYYVKSAKHDSKIADYFLSSSAWTTEFYRKSFWYDGNILEFGSPRSDIFYQDYARYYKKIKEHYQLPDDVKLLLYAPTFRDDGSIDAYDMDYKQTIKLMEKRFGGNWKILLRLHPNILNKQFILHYDQDILNGNTITDINELIVACDMLITDYSSCMFDAMEARKRVIIYASDIEKYRNERGFYFSMEELPFAKAENMQELKERIICFNESEYRAKVDAFKNKLQIFNRGDAAERTLSYII